MESRNNKIFGLVVTFLCILIIGFTYLYFYYKNQNRSLHSSLDSLSSVKLQVYDTESIDKQIEEYRAEFKLKEELKRKEEIIQELEENNLLEELEKESDRIARSIVKDLNIYKDEKDKVYNELKEAYRNILIKNTQKYERIK